MRRKKVLIVDDAELMLKIEESFLDREDVEVFTARSGMTALRQAVEFEPDLILMDLNMPDFNGDEVCARLKSSEALKNIPIIIVTAEQGDPVFKRCIEAGCDGFLIKPFEKRTFLNKIKDQLALMDRKHVRIPTEIPCTFSWETDQSAGVIGNLSMGGAYIKANQVPPEGSFIELKISIPDRSDLLRCNCVVRWEMASGEENGFGVEFMDLPEGARDDISLLLRSPGS